MYVDNGRLHTRKKDNLFLGAAKIIISTVSGTMKKKNFKCCDVCSQFKKKNALDTLEQVEE